MHGPGNGFSGERPAASLSAAGWTGTASSHPPLRAPRSIGPRCNMAAGWNLPLHLVPSAPAGATVSYLTVATSIALVVVPGTDGWSIRLLVVLNSNTLGQVDAINYCCGRNSTARCWSGTSTTHRSVTTKAV